MKPLVGIDLGTTNSVIAVLDRTGRPEIQVNAEGDRITPSAVFFEPETEGQAVVGRIARDHAGLYPGRVKQEFKRDMSRNEPYDLDGLSATPAQLSSLVLRKLASDASARVGAISRAVITVPANFTNEARTATMSAGELAGLDVSHIVNEPTAALLCYADQREIAGPVVVYDFGGGTLDVTVARVSGRDIEIVTSKGDPRLGGSDFDRVLAELIHSAYEAETGEEFDPGTHQLAKTPEEYKHQLSSRAETRVQIVGGPSGRTILTITRQAFEDAASTLLSKADLLVESTLDEAGLEASDIRDLFLVGGSTRMPMVGAHLERIFAKAPVAHVNPDEVVALGAALYAGFKADDADLNPAQATAVRRLSLKEVANHYFGTISIGMDRTGQPRLENSIIIEKNAELPCSKTESYYTVSEGQTGVDCRVTQSATREIDPDFVRTIWDGTLGPLPEGRPAHMEVQVTFSYDANEIMHCVFEDVDSGMRREVDIGLKSGEEVPESADVEQFLVE